MVKKCGLLGLLVIWLMILSVAGVFAITGSMRGNRMTLYAEPGEVIERTLLIQNVNDVPLTIDFLLSGDLKDNVKLEVENFVLEPGTKDKPTEKKVHFTISADKPGRTETKINVRFTPEEGNGIVLASNIILIVSGESSTTGSIDDEPIKKKEEFSLTPSGTNAPADSGDSSFSISPVQMLLASSLILVVIFIALMLYSTKVKPKKKVRRSRE